MLHPEKKTRRGLQKWVAPLLSLILCAIAAAFLLLQSSITPGSSLTDGLTAADSPVLTLRSIHKDDVVRIEVKPSSGDGYTLENEAGTLRLVSGAQKLAITESASEQWLSIATNLTVQGTVFGSAPDEESLSEMGLLPPRSTAVITLRSGERVSLSIGSQVPETSYVYGQYSCFDGVYLCDSGIADMLTSPERRLLPVDEVRIRDELVKGLSLTREGTRYVFSLRSAGETSVGTLLEPFAYPLSESAAEGILNTLSSFYLGSAAPEITDANASDYGFSAPLAVLGIEMEGGSVTDTGKNGEILLKTVEPSSLLLEIGARQGDFFYSLRYQGSYYLVSRPILKYLIESDVGDFLSRNPARISGENLESAELVYDGGSLCLRREGTDAESALLNEETVPMELFTAFSEKLSALTVSGSAPENQTLPVSPHYTLRLRTFEGTTRELCFYKLDSFFDTVSVDGVILHTCYSDTLESLLGILTSAGSSKGESD